MLFQQHFSVKYVHIKPIGFILVRLIYDKNRNGWQLCIYTLLHLSQCHGWLQDLPLSTVLTPCRSGIQYMVCQVVQLPSRV